MVDVFDSESESFPLKGKLFDVCLDKGTYDAVCLNKDHIERKKSDYIQFVDKVLQRNGAFIIASCNWTEEELRKQFDKCNVSFNHKLPAD